MTAPANDWTTGAEALLIRECTTCSATEYLPFERCRECGHGDFRLREATGQGRCVAVTVLRVPRGAGAAHEGLALVELDEGPSVMVKVAMTGSGDDADVAPGERVRVRISVDTQGQTRPWAERSDDER